MNKKNILITGSGPHLPEWWDKNVDKIKDYEVISINTSICITKERCNRWIKSEDYYYYHKDLVETLSLLEKKLKPFDKCKGIPIIPVANYDWPFKYKRNGSGGIMFFNVLEGVINEAFWYNNIKEINIVGCDLIYKSGKINHFYGKSGTNDPMRMGIRWIEYNLKMFKHAFKLLNIPVYNLSLSEETLLPFPRKIL